MNWLDIVIIILVLIPTVIGLRSGVIKTVLFIVGLVSGIILAARYYEAVAGWLSFITQPQAARVAAFVLVFLAVLIVALIVAGVVKWAVTMIMLGWLNNLAGAALGFLAGAIVCGSLLALWVRIFGVSSPIADSFMARALLDRFPVVWEYLKTLPKS